MCKLLFTVVTRKSEHEQVNVRPIDVEAAIGTSLILTRNKKVGGTHAVASHR